MDTHAGNIVLLRGATLWLLVALILAWCLVGWKFGVPFITMTFESFERLLQAHIDFLLMTALIFGIYAAKVPLPWHVRWSIVIGAFTNSSLFLLMSIFPILETQADGLLPMFFQIISLASIMITTYGFGIGAVTILRSTLEASSSN